MRKLLCLTVLLSLPALAQVNEAHVESMLQQMVRENVISAEEAQKAKGRLKSITPEQWQQISATTAKHHGRVPASENKASQNKIENVNEIDLDGQQFQAIQNDLRKIVPQYQD
jgi:hypothetical protein